MKSKANKEALIIVTLIFSCIWNKHYYYHLKKKINVCAHWNFLSKQAQQHLNVYYCTTTKWEDSVMLVSVSKRWQLPLAFWFCAVAVFLYFSVFFCVAVSERQREMISKMILSNLLFSYHNSGCYLPLLIAWGIFSCVAIVLVLTSLIFRSTRFMSFTVMIIQINIHTDWFVCSFFFLLCRCVCTRFVCTASL